MRLEFGQADVVLAAGVLLEAGVGRAVGAAQAALEAREAGQMLGLDVAEQEVPDPAGGVAVHAPPSPLVLHHPPLRLLLPVDAFSATGGGGV